MLNGFVSYALLSMIQTLWTYLQLAPLLDSCPKSFSLECAFLDISHPQPFKFSKLSRDSEQLSKKIHIKSKRLATYLLLGGHRPRALCNSEKIDKLNIRKTKKFLLLTSSWHIVTQKNQSYFSNFVRYPLSVDLEFGNILKFTPIMFNFEAKQTCWIQTSIARNPQKTRMP